MRETVLNTKIVVEKNVPYYAGRKGKPHQPTGQICRQGTEVEIKRVEVVRAGYGARADVHIALQTTAGLDLLADHFGSGVEHHATRALHLLHAHGTSQEAVNHALDRLANSLGLSRALFDIDDFKILRLTA